MKRSTILLAAIFLLALVLRLGGISFGLPHTECRPDESTIITSAVNVALGDPNPHFFHYPSLMIYLLAGIYQLFNVVWHVGPGDTPGLTRMLEVHPTPFFLASPLISALFGALSTLALYKIGRALFNRTTGLLSAFFLSVCYLHVRDSHFGTTDIAMTCFVLLALSFTIRAVQDQGTGKTFGLAGLFTGLAFSTKYGALLLPLSMLVGLLTSATNRQGVMQRLFSRNTWIYGAACVVGFLLFTPFALFDAGTFISHFMSELNHLSVGHTIAGAPMLLGRGWGHHAIVTLPHGLGLPLFVCAILGLVTAFCSTPRQAAIVFAFPLAFYLSAGKGYTVFVRYMIPLTPFLCLAAALLLQRLWGRFPPGRMSRLVLPLLAVLVALPSLQSVVRFDCLLIRQDNRLVTADWLAASLPSGSTVYQTGKPWGHVRLQGELTDYRRADTPPDYIVEQQHPLPYSDASDSQREMLRAGYRKIKTLFALDAVTTQVDF